MDLYIRDIMHDTRIVAFVPVGVRLDGGNGFDVYHGNADGDAIVFFDEAGAERVRLVPGDGDTLTRVLGGNPIQFVRR